MFRLEFKCDNFLILSQDLTAVVLDSLPVGHDSGLHCLQLSHQVFDHLDLLSLYSTLDCSRSLGSNYGRWLGLD